MTLPTPSVEYFLLSPDAHRVRRRRRRRARRSVPAQANSLRRPGRRSRLGGLVAAFVADVIAGRARFRRRAQQRCWARWPSTDRRCMLQGTVLLVAVLGGHPDRRTHASVRNKVALEAGFGRRGPASTRSRRRHQRFPAATAEREADRAGVARPKLFPLHAVRLGGMMVFPASNDLLTMFVALEVLSLPLYLMCGLARRRRLLSQEAAHEVLSAGRVLVGVLPVRRRVALRRDRHAPAVRDPGRDERAHGDQLAWL